MGPVAKEIRAPKRGQEGVAPGDLSPLFINPDPKFAKLGEILLTLRAQCLMLS